MKTVLLIDSCSDLPLEYVEKNNIAYIPFTYEIKGIEHKDDFGKTIKYKDFYDELRKGEMSRTSQVNVHLYYEEFKKHIKEGNSIIYVGFSSGLTGSINNANMAREQIIEEFKDADITIVDTKSASLGEGLLVYYAHEMLRGNYTKNEIVNWLEENKLKLNHWFTVEDLNHLKRGGRISSTAAVVGTLLNIKPILCVDNNGGLVAFEKVKGRKKALKTLVEKLSENIVNAEEQIIGISHGDCIEDAEYLRDLILEKYKVKDFIINNMGPVIGSHTGPGVVTLFFLGDKR